jgi:hypothetical protein
MSDVEEALPIYSKQLRDGDVLLATDKRPCIVSYLRTSTGRAYLIPPSTLIEQIESAQNQCKRSTLSPLSTTLNRTQHSTTISETVLSQGRLMKLKEWCTKLRTAKK